MQSPRPTCVILSSQILPAGTTNYHILPCSFSSRCTPLPDIHSAVELHVLLNCRGHFLFRHILSSAVVTVPSKVDRVRPATIFHQNECNIKKNLPRITSCRGRSFTRQPFSSRCTPMQRAAPLQSRRAPVFLLRPSVLRSLFSFLSSTGTAASLCQGFPDIHSAVDLQVRSCASGGVFAASRARSWPAPKQQTRNASALWAGVPHGNLWGFVHIPRRCGRSTHQPEDAPYGGFGPDLPYHPPLSDGRTGPQVPGILGSGLLRNTAALRTRHHRTSKNKFKKSVVFLHLYS